MKYSSYIDIISQLEELLNQLTNQKYAQPLEVLNDNSIGQHSRHIIEFFQCLLEGSLIGIINYETRQRNPLLEENIAYTQNVILEIVQKISSEKYTDLPMVLVGNNAENDLPIPTNFMRELVYLVEHSIHHYALIRIGVKENFSEIILPPNFGVANSTVRYNESKFNVNQ